MLRKIQKKRARDRVQEALFEEFDFSKLDQEMKTLFRMKSFLFGKYLCN